MSEMPAREQMISAYSELVGLDPVSLGDGVAEVRLPMAAHLRNRGPGHGGALFSLMDVTMGLACSSSHGFDRQSVTLECKINTSAPSPTARCARRPRPASAAAWWWKPRCGKATNWSHKVPSPSCKPARPPCGRMARNRSRSVPGARLDGSCRRRGDRPQDEAKTHLRPLDRSVHPHIGATDLGRDHKESRLERSLSRRLALLGAAANLPLLTECLHGIERECLRVDSDGKLALTPTPPWVRP